MAEQFGAAVAEGYERWMVPMLFAPYARDVVERIGSRVPARILEVACGTGVVTRALAEALPSEIVATDLHPAMLERAQLIGTSRPVEWRQANALDLPFDEEFDLVVCQFGVMFFPDRVKGYAEMRRVLRPGGRLLLSTWDGLAENELATCIDETVAAMFPENPPTFFATIPHGYFDPAAIRADLEAAGFAAPSITKVAARSRADGAEHAARALCGGTPLRNEIEARDPSRLAEAIARSTERIALQFGNQAIDAKMQALIVDVDR